MSTIKFNLNKLDGIEEIEMNYDELLIIGYAGRDMEKTMEHIKELEEELELLLLKNPTIFQCSNLIYPRMKIYNLLGINIK